MKRKLIAALAALSLLLTLPSTALAIGCNPNRADNPGNWSVLINGLHTASFDFVTVGFERNDLYREPGATSSFWLVGDQNLPSHPSNASFKIEWRYNPGLGGETLYAQIAIGANIVDSYQLQNPGATFGQQVQFWIYWDQPFFEYERVWLYAVNSVSEVSVLLADWQSNSLEHFDYFQTGFTGSSFGNQIAGTAADPQHWGPNQYGVTTDSSIYEMNMTLSVDTWGVESVYTKDADGYGHADLRDQDC